MLIHHVNAPVIRGATTETFALDVLGTKTVTVTFWETFHSIPHVTINVCDITDDTADIINVHVENVATTGFDCKAKVITAGAAGSTAKFKWIAIAPEVFMP